MLAAIESNYASSVLLLGAGDATHPDGNGTIKDNPDEARKLMTTTSELIQSAKDWFARGRVLDSADAIERAGGCQRLVEARLQEIRDKQRRLSDTETKNRSLLELLHNRVAHVDTLAKDHRTTRETQEQFSRVQKNAESFATRINVPRSDPFEFADTLQELKTEIDQLESSISADWELHAETARSIDAAEAELEKLRRLEARSATDHFPDSSTTRQILGEADGLKSEFAKTRNSLGEPHGNWNALDERADDLARQAGLLAARLRNDLEEAERAYDALDAAIKQVRSAGRWTGGYGVFVSSQYGADSLARAKKRFQRGDYAAVILDAMAAKRMANQAIERAESELRRRQRAEQARIETEQRQRRAAAQLIASASRRRSSFGSGMGRSGFSSGSGSSRSSFSSGSGTSRSGW